MKPATHDHWKLGVVLAVIAFTFAGCATREPRASKTPTRPGAEMVRVADSAERPGLGTAWGEPRESWVEQTYFARAWENRPSAVGKLFYNDQEGVEAMTAYLGGDPRSAPGLQKSADGLVRLGLRDASGRWFDTLEMRDHRFAVGERGARYEVVLKNETRRRLEVVLSVDGLDTLDGETASFKKRGYVLGPRETVTIDGFRTNESSVSAFRFTNVGDTYAQRRHQQTGNVGVIGLAIFAERWLGTPADQLRPEHRAWRRTEPKDASPTGRRFATPTDA
jgi:hypothetical protein